MRKIVKIVLFCLGIILFWIPEDAVYAQSLGGGTYTVKEVFADEKLAEIVASNLSLSVDDNVTQQRLDEITYLYIGDREITDLDGMQYLRNLEGVSISDAAVTTLEPASGLSVLRQIEIRNIQTLMSLSGLENLPALEKILVDNCSITKIGEWDSSFQLTSFTATNGVLEDIQGLSGQTALIDVDLRKNKITSLEALAGAVQLSVLNVSNNQLTSLDGLEAAVQLQDLDAAKNKITDIGAIASAVNLSILKLNDNKIVDLSPLLNVNNIYFLPLFNNEIESLDGLQNSSSLSSLELQNNKINDISAIRNMTQLTDINLSHNQITDVSGFAAMNSVYDLNLSYNQLESIDFLTSFSGSFTGGSSLNLSNNQISSLSVLDDIFGTVSYAGFNLLNFSNNKISSLSDLSFMSTGGTYTSVGELDVSGNLLTSLAGLENSKISFLKASHNPITDIEALGSIGNLYEIAISHGSLTYDAVMAVNWSNFDSSWINSLDLSYHQLDRANEIYELLLGKGVFGQINLAGNQFNNFDFIIGGTFNLLDLSGTNFNEIKDITFLGQANQILTLNLSNLNTKLTDDDMAEWTSLGGLLWGIHELNLADNDLTSLDFLNVYHHNNMIGKNLEVDLSGNKISSLENSAIASLDGYQGNSLSLNLSNNGISDISGFTGQDYTYVLNLDLSDNHISDVSPLYENYKTVFEEGNSGGFTVVILNQTITETAVIADTDLALSQENKIRGLDSEFVVPSYISDEGSYQAPNLSWDTVKLPDPDAGTVSYQFHMAVPENMQEDNLLTRAIVIPGAGSFEFSGTVAVDYSILRTKYKVTYFGNGNTAGVVPVDPIEYVTGGKATVLGVGNLAKTGYIFKEWNTNSSGSGDGYIAGAEIDITGNVSLYAIWEEDIIQGSEKYTVTYHADDRTAGDVPEDLNSYEAGERATVLGEDGLEKTGHSFKEWNTNSSGSGDGYIAGAEIEITQDVDLYAIWEPNAIPDPGKHIVTYHGNGNTGGTVPVDPVQYEVGDNAVVLAAGDLEKAGHSFVEWCTNAAGTGERYAVGDEIEIIDNVDLYAVWERDSIPEPKYTVTYHGNGNTGGNVPEDLDAYEAGDKATVLAAGDLEKTGHLFKEWNTDPAGSGDSYRNGDEIEITGNVDLYAIWKMNSIPEPVRYRVIYHGNGNTGGNVPEDPNEYQAANKATVLAAGDLIKEGFIFKEWNTDAAGAGASYTAGDEMIIEGNVDLYAVWQEGSKGQPDPKEPDQPNPPKGKDDIKNTPEPEKLDNPSSVSAAETDDVTDIIWWVSMIAVSFIVFGILLVSTKKIYKHES